MFKDLNVNTDIVIKKINKNLNTKYPQNCLCPFFVGRFPKKMQQKRNFDIQEFGCKLEKIV